MRSNSGKDEARDNLHDPTIRDRLAERERAAHRSHRSNAKAPSDQRKGRKD